MTTFELIAGVDEVGRGPLAGPVMEAAVILDRAQPINGLADSKALSEKRRNELDGEIRRCAVAYALGRAEVQEIDRLNIFHASLLAMQRALEALTIVPQRALIDGKFCPQCAVSMEAIISRSLSIAKVASLDDRGFIDGGNHADNRQSASNWVLPAYLCYWNQSNPGPPSPIFIKGSYRRTFSKILS